MATTDIDWTAVATAAGAIVAVAGAGWATVSTIRSNEESIRAQLNAEAEQNRKQQLADLMSTALGHFTGRSQNRGVGIAALKMIEASAANLNREGTLTGDELALYQNSIRTLLYGQLLYLYMYGENRDKAHEAANIVEMSRLLFSDYFDGLQSKQKAALHAAMGRYEVYAQHSVTEPVVSDLLAEVPAWKMQIQTSL